MPYMNGPMTQVTAQLAGAFGQRQEAQLARSAYMGDQAAMAQLSALNPAKAAQIQQMTRTRQQDQISSEDRKRRFALENKELIEGIMKRAASLGNYEDAAAYVEQEKEKYADIIPPDLASEYSLTPEGYNQIQEMMGPTEAQQLGLEKLRLEVDRAKKDLEAEGVSTKELVDIQNKLSQIEERRQKMGERTEKAELKEKEERQREASRVSEAEGALSIIDSALSTDFDLDSIYGRGEALYPDIALSQSSRDMKKKIEGMSSLLELAAAGKLKGQGTITESERAILRRSATLLKDETISPSLARDELLKAADVFSRVTGEEYKPPGSDNIEDLVKKYAN